MIIHSLLGCVKGYGFVHFISLEASIQALTDFLVESQLPSGVIVKCEVSQMMKNILRHFHSIDISDDWSNEQLVEFLRLTFIGQDDDKVIKQVSII
jgi:hypothetical protein